METLIWLIIIAAAGFAAYIYSETKEKLEKRKRKELGPGSSGRSSKRPSIPVGFNPLRLDTSQSSPKEERVKSRTDKNTSYTISLHKQTCTCPDFVDRRSDYAHGDLRRFCKHLARAALKNKTIAIPNHVRPILESANDRGKGVFYEQYSEGRVGDEHIKSPGRRLQTHGTRGFPF